MKAKNIFIIMALIVLGSCSSAQVEIPKGFVETTPPKAGSPDWYELNHSQNEFLIEIFKGKLKVKKGLKSNSCTLKIPGGTLLGVNDGEWGGTLDFVPDKNKKEKVPIKGGNILQIFTFKDSIYFLEGLAHLSMSEGALFKLDTSNNNFTYKELIVFEDAPYLCSIYNDQMLIVSNDGFFIVKDFKKEKIFGDTFWGGLYPQSIAVLDEKNIFIGMRSGIVKVDLSAKEFKFYKYIGK